MNRYVCQAANTQEATLLNYVGGSDCENYETRLFFRTLWLIANTCLIVVKKYNAIHLCLQKKKKNKGETRRRRSSKYTTLIIKGHA